MYSRTDSIQHIFQQDALTGRREIDGSLFNLRRLHAHTKTLEELFRDLFFADDAALVANTEKAIQHLTSCFAEAAQVFGLEVSLKKTEVLHRPAPLEEYRPPHITIGGTDLTLFISLLIWSIP